MPRVCVMLFDMVVASPSWKVPLGASTVIPNVIVLPALVNVIVPRPEKVCVDVDDTVTPDPKI